MIDLDKISEERLFQNNTKEEIQYWVQNLKYFYYIRAKAGHNCEGDSFSVYFKYNGKDDLIYKLGQIGVTLNKLEDGFIAYDPFEAYSFEDLDKIKVTIPLFPDIEQPQYVEAAGYKVHIWVMSSRFEISVSGTKDGKTYRVSEDDFNTCVSLEKIFDELNWNLFINEDIKAHMNCLSREKYPELFE